MAWEILRVAITQGCDHRGPVTLCSQGTIDLVLTEMLFLSNQCFSTSLRLFIYFWFFLQLCVLLLPKSQASGGAQYPQQKRKNAIA